jgi:hypothetical protein
MATLEEISNALGGAASVQILIRQTDLPLTITGPGSYLVAENLFAAETAITVSAEKVTIDLNGFTLTGPGSGSSALGICLTNADWSTVRNGAVREFETGIEVLSAVGCLIEQVLAAENGTGVSVVASNHCTVRDSRSLRNGTGIGVAVGVGNRVERCQVSDSAAPGIGLRVDECSGTLVLQNVLVANDSRGIQIDTSSTSTLVEGNRLLAHSSVGAVALQNGAPGTIALGNVASGNTTDYSGVTQPMVLGGSLVSTTGSWANLDF